MSDFQVVSTNEPMIRLAHAKAMIEWGMKRSITELATDLDEGYYRNVEDAEALLIRRLQDQLEDVDEVHHGV